MITFVGRLQAWFSSVRALPQAMLVAIGLYFLAGLADGVLMPFFALWAQREAGIPTGYIGLMLGCYADGELLATPFVGGIADRVGRRPVLLASTVGIGIGFLLLHEARGAAPACFALLLIGAFESVLHPKAATVIADLAEPGTFRRHYALTRMASGAGHVAGPAVVAVLASWPAGHWGWCLSDRRSRCWWEPSWLRRCYPKPGRGTKARQTVMAMM